MLKRAGFLGSHNEKALIEILDTYPRDELFPDLRRRAVRGGDGDPPPRRAPATAAVRAPRPVRALLLAARVRAARPLQHGEPPPHRGDPAQRDERGEHRLHHPRIRAGARAPPLHGVRGTGPDAGLRRARGGDDARGGHALVGGRPQEASSTSSARSAAGSCSAATARRSQPPTAPTGGALGARGHHAHRGADRARGPRHQPLPPARGRPGETLRAKLFRAGRALTLSDVLPLFENMGVEVADERPYPIVPRGADGVWIYDFGLTYAGAGNLDTNGVREGFQDAFVRAWRGDVENDGYNRLVLGAALTWREITVLRAIGKYLRQARITFNDRYRAGARRAPGDRAAHGRAVPGALRPGSERTARTRTRWPPASRRRSTPSRASTRTRSCACSYD